MTDDANAAATCNFSIATAGACIDKNEPRCRRIRERMGLEGDQEGLEGFFGSSSRDIIRIMRYWSITNSAMQIMQTPVTSRTVQHVSKWFQAARINGFSPMSEARMSMFTNSLQVPSNRKTAMDNSLYLHGFRVEQRCYRRQSNSRGSNVEANLSKSAGKEIAIPKLLRAAEKTCATAGKSKHSPSKNTALPINAPNRR